ncbi:hypothetical protein FHS49_000824 [Sphingobium boeckii]|uniref:Uncharacterized protein n=1 Tax=Sphingobium boeckii TaxID=1082345 RepID=A0A7W9AFQ1_9SPHN|nr:hypothetical protein [Sphingobium boeckii]
MSALHVVMDPLHRLTARPSKETGENRMDRAGHRGHEKLARKSQRGALMRQICFTNRKWVAEEPTLNHLLVRSVIDADNGT